MSNELPKRLQNELAEQPAEEQFTRVKHSVNLGDLVAAMAVIKKYHEVTKRKIIVSQMVGRQAAYYPGATHPTVNEQGQMVCVNDAMFDMAKPLVESQEYVQSFERYSGQRVDLDFDVIRGKTFVNLPHGAIQAWLVYAFPDLAFDLSRPWIELKGECPENIKEQVSGKIIINFTERYRNDIIDYFFLKGYEEDIIFAGTEKEHWNFCHRWNLNVQRLEVVDFLELAYAIKEAKFLLSNQSFCWNLAEAQKTPRILEICSYAQNCQSMIGEDSYGFFHQVGVEYYWRKLYKKTLRK